MNTAVFIIGICQIAVTAAVHIVIAELNYQTLQTRADVFDSPACPEIPVRAQPDTSDASQTDSNSQIDEPFAEDKDDLILDFSLPEREGE